MESEAKDGSRTVRRFNRRDTTAFLDLPISASAMRAEDADRKMTVPKDSPAPKADEDADEMVFVGARTRAIRIAKGMTIADVAQKSGLSAGVISQIERDKSNPSIKTLKKLRSALEVNLWEFLESTDPLDKQAATNVELYIRRKSERHVAVVGKSQLIKELLSPRNDENLRFMLVTLPPGSESEDVLQSHGFKGGMMLSGRAVLSIEGATGELDTGDSFQFPADVPHQISNPHSQPAEVLWIMSIADVHL